MPNDTLRPVSLVATLVGPADSVGQRLKGKGVLITGTARGVGAATQDPFARHGAYVSGCDIAPGGAAASAEKLKAVGLLAEGYEVDLVDPASAKWWVDMAVEKMGGIDVLVNNASKPEFSMFGDMAYELWQKSLQNEVNNVFLVTRAAWPHLIAAGGGSVFNLGSTIGVQGTGANPQVAHAAGKAAVVGFPPARCRGSHTRDPCQHALPGCHRHPRAGAFAQTSARLPALREAH